MDERLTKNPLGFFEIKDKPSEQDLQRFYSEEYYQNSTSCTYQHEYSPEESRLLRHKAEVRRDHAQQISGRGEKRFLDVGCGEGWMLDAFQASSWNVIGVDYSEHGLQSMNPHLVPQVFVGDIYAYLDAAIDKARVHEIVNLDHVLEHVLDPAKLLERLHRIVAPEGCLMLAVPNDDTAYHAKLIEGNRVSRSWWISPPDHLNYFSAESLRKLVHATGWTFVDLWADFPIDWYLANEYSNYVDSPELGPAAHSARLLIEECLAERGAAAEIGLYRALADCGLGRSLTAFLQPA